MFLPQISMEEVCPIVLLKNVLQYLAVSMMDYQYLCGLFNVLFLAPTDEVRR